MLKNIKDLSNLIKIDNQKDVFNDVVFDILKIIKNESSISLKEKDIFLKRNVLKIKSNSNNRFIIFLHMKEINKSIKDLNQNLILEL
jgi:hypothetical protein